MNRDFISAAAAKEAASKNESAIIKMVYNETKRAFVNAITGAVGNGLTKCDVRFNFLPQLKQQTGEYEVEMAEEFKRRSDAIATVIRELRELGYTVNDRVSRDANGIQSFFVNWDK